MSMKSPFLLTLSALTLLVAAQQSAWADDSAPVVTTEAPTLGLAMPSPRYTDASAAPVVTRWYGWETMMVDGLSAGLLSAAILTDNNGAQAPFAVAGLTGFTLGAPIVHASRGRWGLAFADLGLRVGAIALGALVGGEVGRAAAPSPLPCDGGSLGAAIGCATASGVNTMGYELDAALVGAAIGALAASTIDATVLSREKVRAKDQPAPSFSWSPSFSALKNGAAGGITGTF
jgi:hypothetical protein